MKYDLRQHKTKTLPFAPSFTGGGREVSRFEQQDKTGHLELLDQAYRDWMSLAEFRKNAQRCEKYADGEQWSDLIADPDHKGRLITESDYIKRQGKVPLIQNKIYSIVRNLMGQYRSNDDKALVLVADANHTDQEQVLTDVLQSVAAANNLGELDAVAFNEFLYSGMMAQRLSFQHLKEYDRSDVFIENIGYHRIFFNPDVKDPRLIDINRIGVIHDLSLDELLAQFCRSEADKRWLTDYFTANTSINLSTDSLQGKHEKRLDFMASYDTTRLRVYECWYLCTPWKTYIFDAATGSEGMVDLVPEQIEAVNENRRQKIEAWNRQAEVEGRTADMIPEEAMALIEYRRKIEPEWQVKYLLADGTCLLESSNPFAHQEHPFALTLFPMTSGNVYGIVKQIIDQQRMFNRIIMLWDFMLGAGAKGVLLVPEECLGDRTPEEFADEWVRFNGVIVYKPSNKPNAVPQQVTANSVPAGLFEMMGMVSGLFQDISGVHNAIQGAAPAAGTSGTLYQQQAINASTNTLDIMKKTAAFKEVRDRKILKIATQFYNGKRRIVSGDGEQVLTIDPEKIRDIDFELRIIPNTNTPAYRQVVEDRLTQMVMSGMIPPEIYFQNSSDPTARKIYDSLLKMKDNQAQQAQVQQAAQNNPQAVARLQQAVT